ncbi:MAG: EVE domain-containing protein [Parcubacteria group bacterium]|nr:EVE domain-containing protein [Parcubacteria group bacterium]
MNYWLMKTEPSTYSWDDLVTDKITCWDGVRNYQARNMMRAMKKGDLVFVYHSVKQTSIKGIAKVVKEAYPDSTALKGDWSMVDIQAVKPVGKEIALQQIKKDPFLQEMTLVTHSRLSVQPVTKEQWERCLVVSETKI